MVYLNQNQKDTSVKIFKTELSGANIAELKIRMAFGIASAKLEK